MLGGAPLRLLAEDLVGQPGHALAEAHRRPSRQPQGSEASFMPRTIARRGRSSPEWAGPCLSLTFPMLSRTGPVAEVERGAEPVRRITLCRARPTRVTRTGEAARRDLQA
nr:hypothetical protein GCM10025732_57480 [Glycomyces mayteni]